MPEITFYSKTPGLKCWAGKSEYKSVEGTLRMVDPPLIQFTPLPGQPFGYFKTEDPDVIAYLRARMANGGDVVGEEEFAKAMVPAEQRAKLLEDANRVLLEENRLLRQVKAKEAAQEAVPVPEESRPAKPIPRPRARE